MAITTGIPDSAIDVALKPFLVWDYSGAASPVFKVQLTLAADTGYASPIIDVTVNDVDGQSAYGSYQLLEDLAVSTDYIWRVSDDNGSNWTDSTFTTRATNTLIIPVITSAHIDNATNVNINETFKWINDDLTDVYIEYDDNPAFTSPVQHTGLAANSAWDFTPLDADTFYWLRIKRTTAGDWFNVRFYTGVVFSEKPTINNPINGADTISLTPLFDWDIASGADTYTIQLSDNGAFSNLLLDVSDLTDLNYTLLFSLQNATLYYWRVKATNEFGDSEWSDENAFTTILDEPVPLGPPDLLSPTNVVIDQSTSPTFTWSTVEDADTFEIQIADNNSFNPVTDTADDIGTTEYTTSTVLDYDTIYFWRVRSKNIGETSGWSEIFQLRTIAAVVPLQAVLLSPDHEATEQLVQPTLDWESLDTAESYKVEIATDSEFAAIVYSRTGVVGSNHVVDTPIAYNTLHYWRVRGTNSFGDGTWSDTRSFTTAAQGSVATLDLKYKVEFNETTKKLGFIDNLNTQYFSTYAIPLIDIIGLIKIEGPTGIVYKNAGYDDDDFEVPDIDGAEGVWSINDISPGLNSNSNIVNGEYIISYKVSADRGVSLTYSSSNTYTHIYSRPPIAFKRLVNLDASTLTLVDTTAYSIYFYGTLTEPTGGIETIRNWIVRFPGSSGQPNATGDTEIFVVGPKIWTGNYDILIYGDLEYFIDEWDGDLEIIIKDNFAGEDGSLTITNVVIETVIYNCFLSIDKNYQDAKQNNIAEANRLRLVRADLSYYYTLFETAIRSGNSIDYALNMIKDLLQQEKVLVPDDLTVSKEVVTRAEYFIDSSNNIDTNIITSEFLENISDQSLLNVLE